MLVRRMSPRNSRRWGRRGPRILNNVREKPFVRAVQRVYLINARLNRTCRYIIRLTVIRVGRADGGGEDHSFSLIDLVVYCYYNAINESCYRQTDPERSVDEYLPGVAKQRDMNGRISRGV